MRARLLLSVFFLVGCSGGSGGTDAALLDAGALDAGALDAAADADVDRPAPLRACPTSSSAPIDLVPLAHLTATGTTTVFLDWVREDRDALATLRDDAPDTVWSVARGRAVARLDLAAAGLGTVPLDRVELSVDGTPRAVEVVVLEACGGGYTARKTWGDLTQPLSLADTCGACVELRLDLDAPAKVTRLALYGRAPAPPDEPAPMPAASIAASAGIVEGFYGVPWTHAERLRAIDGLSRAGLGYYLYAPKDDPRHRARWRDAYPPATLARFGELASFARARGVRFAFGISPFLDYDATRPADFEALLAKLRTLSAQGITDFSILADDIEFDGMITVDATLGNTHRDVVERVRTALRPQIPSLTLSFVPTVYSDARVGELGAGSEPYLRAIGGLDASVEVLWTGTDTTSATLAARDLETVRSWIGRSPVIWDNYYANDGGDGFAGRILLASYAHRDADLRGAARGVLQNPSVQGALSRLSVAGFGAWWRGENDPAQLRAYGAGLEARYGADTDVLAFAMETFDGWAREPPQHAEFARRVLLVTARLSAGEVPAPEDLSALLDLAARLSVLGRELHHARVSVDVLDELAYPALRAEADGELVLRALELLATKLSGRDDAAASGALTTLLARQLRASRFTLGGDETMTFVQAVQAFSPRAAGFVAPAVRDPMPPCAPGGVQFTPFEAGAEVRVFGLGATVSAGAVQWTPPHVGTFDAVLVAHAPAGALGYTIVRVTRVCVPAL